MQRLFSTFADGLPGGGILLIRILTGCILIYHGIGAIGADPHAGIALLEIICAAAGLLILGGLWTPVAGVLSGLIKLWISFSGPAFHPSALMPAILCISLAMIGPGAWSIDARLYGRKQLLPPQL